MSATDELRRMLDERGVAHSDHYLSTTWRDRHGILYLAGEPMADGSLVVDMLTPEQAIAATLGNSRAERTCEPKWTLQGKTQTQEFWRCECGNCGYEFGVEDRRTFPFEITIDEVDVPNFCPECGAKQKVVGE